jgi:hypothetical protein
MVWYAASRERISGSACAEIDGITFHIRVHRRHRRFVLFRWRAGEIVWSKQGEIELNWIGTTSNSVWLVLAQQGNSPLYGNNEAYENGQQVGQIAVYVMLAAVVLWGVASLIKKRKKP